MGWKLSGLAELEKLRRRGSKPDHAIVIADDGIGAAWAMRNQYFLVARRDVAEDFTAFAGLHVWIRTGRPFAESAEFAFALADVALSVTLVDSRGRVPCEYVSSMRAISALVAA